MESCTSSNLTERLSCENLGQTREVLEEDFQKEMKTGGRPTKVDNNWPSQIMKIERNMRLAIYKNYQKKNVTKKIFLDNKHIKKNKLKTIT